MEEIKMDEKIVSLSDEELASASGGATAKKYIQYKIVRGDTLSHLARVYHTTVDELVRINHIADKNKIYAGDTILIPVR